MSVAAQAGLCLALSDIAEGTFCRVMAQMLVIMHIKGLSIGRASCIPAMLLIHMDRVKRIWYLSPMRAAKVQASLRIRAVSPEPPLLAHTSSESRGTFRQKARSLALLNVWACAVKICHDGMLEDTNSLDGAHMKMEKVARPSVKMCETTRTILA